MIGPCSGCIRLEAKIATLEARFGSHFAGGDVIARRVIFESGTIASNGTSSWIGLAGSRLSGSEADGDDVDAATGATVQSGIVISVNGSTPVPLGGGSYPVYDVRLRPVTVANVWAGETVFDTGYTDLIQASMLVFLRGRIQRPGIAFTYSTETGYITFPSTSPPWQAGETVPASPQNEFFCHQAERLLAA